MSGQPSSAEVDLSRFRRLLAELKEHWRRVGAPVADLAAPGRSHDEIDARTATVGLRLPVEAREWFAWHDGCIDRTLWGEAGTRMNANLIGANAFGLVSLDAAIERLSIWRHTRANVERQARAGLDLDPEAFWPSSLFPLTVMPHGGTLAVDCSVPEGAATPVRYADTETEPTPRLCAPSLTAAVELWVDLLARDVWRYNPVRGWDFEFEELDRVDPQLRYNPLT